MLIWPNDRRGDVIVKPTYHFLRSCSRVKTQEGTLTSHKIENEIGKTVWPANVPPKVSNFLYKVCSDDITTLSNLKKRKVLVESSCAFCGVKETISIVYV